jgi:hypothetical protein
LVLSRWALIILLLPAAALGQRETTRDALSRVEETLTLKLERGGLAGKDVLPLMVVSVTPAFEETRAWYPNAALRTLIQVFGAAGLRACEACMAPRLSVEEGRLIQQSTAPTADELIRIDQGVRGTAAPARAAIYLDETVEGVTVRIIDLRNSRILLAENFDPSLREMTRTRRNFTLSEELDRRSRGDSLSHTFFDVTMYPGLHISGDWTEQWGNGNANLSGVTLALFDPVMGVGGVYYRVIPSAMNIMVGGKLIMSVPTALVQGITGESIDLLDPLLTGVFVARLPIGSSNYGVSLTASTNGQVGLGFSLMNLTSLPFLP